jgi:hypothetical protein
LIGLVAAAAALAQAQDPPAGGTKPGDIIPSTFRAFLVTDDRFPPKVSPPTKPEDRDPRDRTNKIHCLVCENGQSPVVAVFVRSDPKNLGGDSGVAKLAQAVNRLIPQYRGDRLAGFVNFLKLEGVAADFENAKITTTVKNPDDTKTTIDVAYGKTGKVVTVTDPQKQTTQTELGFEYPDDERRDALVAEVRDFAAEVKAPNVPFGLAPTNSKATQAWGIGEKDEVTVIIYNRLRVAKRWTFDAKGPTDEQVKEIVAATEEMITGEPKK